MRHKLIGTFFIILISFRFASAQPKDPGFLEDGQSHYFKIFSQVPTVQRLIERMNKSKDVGSALATLPEQLRRNYVLMYNSGSLQEGGSGRKNNSGTVSHAKRDSINFKNPLHITLKVRGINLNLRSTEVLREFERAALGARSFGLRILHFSILKDHVHLIVEASGNSELGDGMRSLRRPLGDNFILVPELA